MFRVFSKDRLKSASAVVAALSRPSSQKSGAWSKQDPEAGRAAKEQEIEEAKKLAAKKKKKKDELGAMLEEAMEEEKASKVPQPVGCWTKFIGTLSSKPNCCETFVTFTPYFAYKIFGPRPIC